MLKQWIESFLDQKFIGDETIEFIEESEDLWNRICFHEKLLLTVLNSFNANSSFENRIVKHWNDFSVGIVL